MPVTGIIIANAIYANGLRSFSGSQYRVLCDAIGTSIASWIKLQANVVVVGSTNGAAGGGTVTGKLAFVPVIPAMSAAFTANTLVGPSAKKLAFAISKGVQSSLTASAEYRGQSTGAIGADISKVVFANPATLIPILKSNMGAKRLLGLSTTLLASAIATGVVAIVMTGTGTGVAAGPAGPAPSTGISRSKVF